MSGFERHGYRFTDYRTSRLDKLQDRKDRLYRYIGLTELCLSKADQWSRVILKINRALERERTICDRIDRIYNWMATPTDIIFDQKIRARDRAMSEGFSPRYICMLARTDSACQTLRKLKRWN